MIPAVKPQPASTRRMIQRLQTIRNTSDPDLNSFQNPGRVELNRRKLATAANANEKFSLEMQLAVELLNSGRPEPALQQIQDAEEFLKKTDLRFNAEIPPRLRMLKATAMLRLGELENCLDNNNAASCLFPLAPAAFHRLPRGSRGAIALFSEQLQEAPQDLSARWLLNLAYMTLGEYPKKVPARWLVPPRTFQSECAFPQFPNVASALGGRCQRPRRRLYSG